ncbi:uncharacterized protein LTR77_002751 [Saxophila tyrrhenica]|uniref:BTB domain-containing protein n=1 Tax=Saxophila tyrrhenica TaxID=1690608 RepID=A0AAV9PG34_9PEZI|nr:hypothetical protein LTR77_002751 [Saxophila tyrrhenica]
MATSNVHHEALVEELTELMKSGKYTDLTTKCGNREWHVHKAIVCTASCVIATECDGEMKEGLSGVIEQEEFDEETVDRMITYVYTRSYTVKSDHPMFGCSRSKGSEPYILGSCDPSSETGWRPEDDGMRWEDNGELNRALIAHVDPQAFALERFKLISGAFSRHDYNKLIKAVWEQTSYTDQQLRTALVQQAVNFRHKWILTCEDYDANFALEKGAQEFMFVVLRRVCRIEEDERLRMHEAAEAERRELRLGQRLGGNGAAAAVLGFP